MQPSTPSHSLYRRAVLSAWSDRRITAEELQKLEYMRLQLGLSEQDCESIELEVLGVTKEDAFFQSPAGGPGGFSSGVVPTPVQPPSGSTLSGALTQDPRSTPLSATPFPSPGLHATPTTLQPGQMVAGRYRILSVLGRGGMGEVLKVEDLRLGETLALKVVSPQHAGRPDLEERLRREVKLCRSLRHPGIVQVHDFDSVSGLSYLTMEFVPGTTLREWILKQPDRVADLAKARHILESLCEALDHAHRQGVVHLDLKPENIMVSEGLDRIRILDFGIGRAVGRKGLQTVVAGAGTPYYMAPEQEFGLEVDARADVYSLAAILYELLTGVPPRGRFAAPSDVRSCVPRALSDRILDGLDQDPSRRPSLRDLMAAAAAPGAASAELSAAASGRPEEVAGARPEGAVGSTMPALTGDGRLYHHKDVGSLRREAEAGHAAAMHGLGLRLERGYGVDRDVSEAVRLYRQAANRGYALAYWELGRCHWSGIGVAKDVAACVASYQKAMELGLPAAFRTMGRRYQYGQGVPKDASRARHLFEQALELGDGEAGLHLADLLEEQDVSGASEALVQKVRGKAVEKLKVAIDQGDSVGQRLLGECSYFGTGVEEDEAEAARFFKLSADQGDPVGQRLLGECFYFGTGVEEDEAEAARFFKLSADQGDSVGQWRLGECYKLGTGVEEDEAEAARLFKLSADQRNSDAQWLLGSCHEQGVGVDVDQSEALRLYQLSADQGNAHAMYRMGQCHESGIGVEKSLAESVRFYELAANQGSAHAQCRLGELCMVGSGRDKSMMKAVEYFALAADQDHQGAIEKLREVAIKVASIVKLKEEGLQLLKIAADRGVAEAQVRLGMEYESAGGVQKSDREAVRYYRLAADQGNAEGLYRLGLCLRYGVGVREDRAEATKMLRLAAQEGHAKARDAVR